MKIIPVYERLHSGEHLTRVLKTDTEGLEGSFTLRLAFVTPSGQVFISGELAVSDGVSLYPIPSSLLDTRGELICQAVALFDDGRVLKSDCLRLPVKQSVDVPDCPEASDEALKSLADIFNMIDAKADEVHSHGEYALRAELPEMPERLSELHNDMGFVDGAALSAALEGKADTGHSHGEYALKAELPEVPEMLSQLDNDTGFVNAEFVSTSLLSKSDTGHTHAFSELSAKPGDVEYSSEVFSFDSVPFSESLSFGGYAVSFEHNVKKAPNGGLFILEYTLALEGSPQRMISAEYFRGSEPAGEAFIPINCYAEYEDFYTYGFPEGTKDNAFVIHLKPDGTGQLFSKLLLTGAAVTLTGPDYISEKWHTLPSSAVESVWDAVSGDGRLMTSGGVYRELGSHNTSAQAHQDLRVLLTELSQRINAVADSDDTTLDQLSEIVSYIRNNKELIEAVTTDKVSYSDIIANLETNMDNKPLSASAGVALKALIDDITVPVLVSQLTNDAQYVSRQTLDGELAQVRKTFVVTAYADFENGILTSLSHTYTQIKQAFEEGAHIILNADIGRILPNAKGCLPLVAIDDNGVYFSATPYMGNVMSIAAGINADGSTYVLVTPLVSHDQLEGRLGGLTFGVSDTAPEVDNNYVVTFVDEG